MLDGLINAVANLGFTLLICVLAIIIVMWLDKNIFNKNRSNEDD